MNNFNRYQTILLLLLLFNVLFLKAQPKGEIDNEPTQLQIFQNSETAILVDSLLNDTIANEKLVEKLTTNSWRTTSYSIDEILYYAGKTQTLNGNFELANLIFSHLLNKKRPGLSKDQVLDVHLAQASCYLELRFMERALIQLDLAEDILKKTKDKNTTALILFKRGVIADNNGTLDEAFELFQNAIDMLGNPEDDPVLASNIYSNISSLHSRLKNYDQAVSYSDQAIALLTKNNLRHELLGKYLNRGILEKERGDFSSAKKWYNTAIEEARINGTKYNLAQLFLNLGNVETHLKNFSDAESCYDSSTMYCQQLNSSYGIYLNAMNKGNMYLEAKDYNNALVHLKEAKVLSTEFKLAEEEMNLAQMLAATYAGLNDFKNAYTYLDYNKVLNDSLTGGEIAQRILELETKYQNEKAKNEILELNEIVLEQSSRIRKYIILVLLFVLIFAGFIAFYFFSRKTTQFREKMSKEKIARMKLEMQLKDQELMAKVMNIAQVNEVFLSFSQSFRKFTVDLPSAKIREIKTQFKELERKFPDAAWKEFEYRFEQVHVSYNSRLVEKYPTLTANEIKICNFLILNLSTKEIAALTNRSIKTVENTRSSIRHKLQLNTDTNLTAILLEV